MGKRKRKISKLCLLDHLGIAGNAKEKLIISNVQIDNSIFNVQNVLS